MDSSFYIYFQIMSEKSAAPYVSGVAVHWYVDSLVPAGVLDQTHQAFPQLPILYTEACNCK